MCVKLLAGLMLLEGELKSFIDSKRLLAEIEIHDELTTAGLLCWRRSLYDPQCGNIGKWKGPKL